MNLWGCISDIVTHLHMKSLRQKKSTAPQIQIVWPLKVFKSRKVSPYWSFPCDEKEGCVGHQHPACAWKVYAKRITWSYRNKMYKTKQFVLKYLQNFLVELIFIVIANDTTIVVKLTINVTVNSVFYVPMSRYWQCNQLNWMIWKYKKIRREPNLQFL